MGYSLAVHATPEGQRKMLTFLKAYRSWALVSKGVEDDENRGSSAPTDDVSYDNNKKGLIGFDYSSWLPAWERVYVYSVVRWVALKVSKRRSVFSKDVVKPNKFPEPIPYIVYDGFERWPVLVKESYEAAQQLPEGQRWCAYDAFGVYLNLSDVVKTTWVCTPIDKRSVNEYLAEIKLLGECPEDAEAREKHLAKLDEIMLKHFRQPIEERLAVVRDELKRLDGLWNSL